MQLNTDKKIFLGGGQYIKSLSDTNLNGSELRNGQ